MRERWRLDGSDAVLNGDQAVDLVRTRLTARQFGTTFCSDAGRFIGMVSNGRRMMCCVMSDDSDLHVVDPTAGDGSSGGFILDNGQADEYADRDTVDIERGLQRLRHFIDTGRTDPEDGWVVDR